MAGQRVTEVHPTLIRLFMGLTIAALVILALVYGRPILLPLVLAVLIAYLVSALARWLHDMGTRTLRLPMWPCTLLSLVIFGLGLTLFVNVVSTNLSAVLAAAPGYQANIEQVLTSLAVTLDLEEIPTIDQLWRDFVAEIQVESMIGQVAISLKLLAGNLFLIILYVAFALLEAGTIRTKLLRLAADESELETLQGTLERIGARVRHYVALKTLVSLLTGGASWIVMAAMGIDFAGFWAVLIFALNFVPYIGPVVAVAFPVTLALLQFGSLAAALWALLALTAVQILIGQILEPRLMGQSLNLSPIVIVLSLVTWGTIWGIVGAVLCVPITVIMVIVFAQFDTTRSIAVLLSKDGDV